MSALPCIREIVFGLTCTLTPTPFYSVDLPQPFIYGSAVEQAKFEPRKLVYEIAVATPKSKPKIESAEQTVAVTFPDNIISKSLEMVERVEIKRTKSKKQTKRTKKRKESKTLMDYFNGSDEEETVAVAYAPNAARGLGRLVERAEKKRYDKAGKNALYVLVDGNEDMGCVVKNQRLMRAIQKVRKKFGKPVGIDSAYRSPQYNRKVRGAKFSQHMNCAAVDMKIPGVDKQVLFNYVRSLPEIGGVGIYSSNMVHMDTGSYRSWDWRGKKNRKRTKRRK